MTSPARAEPVRSYDPPRLDEVGWVVHGRIDRLQRDLLDGSGTARSGAVAALARLRRGLGKPPGVLLDVIEYIVSDRFDVPGDERGTERREGAAHLAITLYAAHQQSQGTAMHRRGRGLGGALRALHAGAPGDLPAALRHRFRLLGTADSFTELSYHLRGAVQLLRAGQQPMDYGLLADQLVTWQRFGRAQVQLAWGRDFYRTAKPANETEPADAEGPDPAPTTT